MASRRTKRYGKQPEETISEKICMSEYKTMKAGKACGE